MKSSSSADRGRRHLSSPAWSRGFPIVVALLLLVPTAVDAQSGSEADSTWIGVTADSPPSVLLAFQDLGTLRVPTVAVERYETLLTRLSRTCHNSKSELARMAHGSVTWLENHVPEEEELSRLDFLRQFNRSLGDPLHAESDCGNQASSVVVGMADNAGLRDRQLRSIRQLVEQLPSMSIGAPGG